MAGMTQRMQAANTRLAGDCDDGSERLRSVPMAPCIPGQHVTSHSSSRILEIQACTAEKLTGSRFDEVWTCRPAKPFRLAGCEKGSRIFNRLMPWPAQEFGDLRIARVPGKQGFSIGESRLP